MRVTDTAKLFDLELERLRRGVPESAICFFRDGDQWCCVRGDFTNLQESPAGFGATFDEAFSALMSSGEQPAQEEPHQADNVSFCVAVSILGGPHGPRAGYLVDITDGGFRIVGDPESATACVTEEAARQLERAWIYNVAAAGNNVTTSIIRRAAAETDKSSSVQSDDSQLWIVTFEWKTSSGEHLGFLRLSRLYSLRATKLDGVKMVSTLDQATRFTTIEAARAAVWLDFPGKPLGATCIRTFADARRRSEFHDQKTAKSNGGLAAMKSDDDLFVIGFGRDRAGLHVSEFLGIRDTSLNPPQLFLAPLETAYRFSSQDAAERMAATLPHRNWPIDAQTSVMCVRAAKMFSTPNPERT